MKFKHILILLSPFLFINAFAWGEEGHSLIAGKAVNLLPAEMKQFKDWQLYIQDHASDADKRKKEDKTEEPKHYIDIDYYSDFHAGEMIIDRNNLSNKYGDSIVNQMGILPWATLETYTNLVAAFKDRNRDRILIHTADLAHYVADGHQPMHTVLNYDGQLSSQKGLHARYEIHMINKNLVELESSFYNQSTYLIEEPLDFIFHYITNANLLSDLIFSSDLQAFSFAGSRENDDYYRILWFRTKYITVLQMNNAAGALASMIYSAWNVAGKPSLNDLE
jgi:hypothetical protein